MSYIIEAFAALASLALLFIGSAVVAGLWLGMVFWHAKAFFEFLP